MTSKALNTIDNINTVPSTRNKGIPVDKIRDLLQVKGNTQEEAASMLGCSKALIPQQCAKYGILSKHQLTMYKAQRADIIAGKHAMVMDCITVEKAEKAPLRDLVVAQGILYDKERLERDLSTGNFAIQVAEQDLSKLDAELARLEREID